MRTFGDATDAFLAARPEWTVNGALLKTSGGRAARVTQTPFSWLSGGWESRVTILPVEPVGDAKTIEIKVRVTPDTLRRWAEVGINPYLEACAQLEEYWRTAGSESDDAELIWL